MMMVEKAAAFAAKAHEGMFRKGSRVPYIVHPMEAAAIVSAFTEDEEVLAAALLHDVIEDTKVTREMLEREFNSRVAELVGQESEDKSKSWKERKGSTLEHLKHASWEIKVLALGDKLSNMRCTARDYLAVGDQVWQRFNEKQKAMHAWYYWGIADALKELSGHLYYQEYILLCEKVFGKRDSDSTDHQDD